LEYLKRKGAPVLKDAVEPKSWFYWQAYHHLRGSRQRGHDIGAIPFSEISDYSEWLGQTCPVDKARLVRFVMAMDNVEREFLGRKPTG
jgi:hypothetical protein